MTDQIETEQPPVSDDAAHLDGFRAAELEDVAPDDDVQMLDEHGEPVAATIDPEQITKDAFFTVFEKAFWFPGAIMPPLAPLAIQPGHEQTLARDASDAIYEILEIYWPGALFPQSDMLARVMVILPFAMLKFATARALLQAAKQPPKEATPQFQTRRTSPPPEPANDTRPPPANDNEVPHLSRGILDGFEEAA